MAQVNQRHLRLSGAEGAREMTVQMLAQLHCGACGVEFDSLHELNAHIETCPAAEVMLPLIHMSVFNDQIGHPFSGWVRLLNRSQSLIRQYAHSIAGNFDNLTRSKIHLELCESLEIKYRDFKPFESEAIKSVPQLDEANKIIWTLLCAYILHDIYKVDPKPLKE